MKYKLITAIGLAGSTLATLFGGWDSFLQTLLIFMAVDWFTGGILLPAVFGKSPKSPNGALESRAGWKGLCRKAMTLFYVLVAAQLDQLMGTEYLRNAVCIGFIANEGLSIIENAGLMGLPLPTRLKKGIDMLKSSVEEIPNQ
ncbi:MAG: phage holin family protein [Eubacteriales bacterium]|nr:phage holin family protein [Eubacteriales bacterium]